MAYQPEERQALERSTTPYEASWRLLSTPTTTQSVFFSFRWWTQRWWQGCIQIGGSITCLPQKSLDLLGGRLHVQGPESIWPWRWAHCLARFELQPHLLEHFTQVVYVFNKVSTYHVYTVNVHSAVSHLQSCQHQVDRPLHKPNSMMLNST